MKLLFKEERRWQRRSLLGTPKKATTHVNQNEDLIFEKSSAGKKGYRLAQLDVPVVDAASLLGDVVRTDGLGVMPELSEIEIIRHFTRLSTWNYAIDLGMYPLGSCTMKYNPRINETVARIEGLAEAHPYQPESLSQGALGIMKLLSECLGGDYGHGHDYAAAGGGCAGRVYRDPDGAGVSRGQGECSEEDHHSGLGAWDEPRDGCHLWLSSREPEVECAGGWWTSRSSSAWWMRMWPR